MKKRTFLKTSSVLVAGGMLGPLTSCSPQKKEEIDKVVRTNWAGNYTYSAENFHLPNTVEEVQKVVKSCDKLRALGSRHCFNDIADSPANQISLENMTRIVELNEEAKTVTVEAGVRYGELCPYLHERGYALHNLASLPHISVVGACATATHGSGMENGNLPTAATGIEFINASGELVTLNREKDGEKFAGAIVHLGGLGVITKVTLNVEPAYQVRQDVYQFLPIAQLEDNFEEIMSSGYSVSLFTDWQTDRVNQVWIKRKIEEDANIEAPASFFGAQLADRNIHPIVELSAENCTEQMGVAGSWYERLPHFRMDFTPSSGTELQAEYFVPRQHAVEAFRAIRKLKEQIGPLLMITEIRAVAADDLWMSPCYRQPCMVFHFTLEQDWENVKKLLPVLEQELQAFEARPHWGKMFTMAPDRLQSLYPKLPDFRKLLAEYDPQGKFANPYLQKHIL